MDDRPPPLVLISFENFIEVTEPARRVYGHMGRFLCVQLAVLIVCISTCFGVEPYQPVHGDPLLKSWRWRTFPELSGLDAQCVTAGPGGTMWFGTGDGLSSYDGIEWTRHVADTGILGGWVSGVCVQSDGAVNAGGWWGISQLSHGKWTRLIPAVGDRFADVRRLANGPEGSLWAATSWGALQRQQSTWTLFTDPATAARLQQDQRYRFLNIELLPETVRTKSRGTSMPTNRSDLTEVCADRQGRIWFGTKGGEVLCFAPAPVVASVSGGAASVAPTGIWSIFNESDGMGSGRNPSILPLQDGTIWVAHGSSEQVSIFDGNTWRTIPLPTPGVAPDGARLLQTRDGVIWLSARYVLFAYRAGKWRKYEKPEVPLPTATNLLAQSADGALWIVAPNADIQRVDYETPRWLTLEDLNFQWESPTGTQWFLHRDGRVVVHESDRWVSLGVEDGLIDTPVALLGTCDGSVWVAGSHEHIAAAARFDGKKWTRYLHNDLSWGIDWRGLFESADGSVWFGAAVDSSGPKQHRDGILQFRDGVWIHHHQPGRSPREDSAEIPATLLPASHRPEPIEKFSSLGESRDGKIWAGRNVLAFHDGKKWEEFFPTPDIRLGIIETMFTTRDGDLWIGTRQYGALRYDGRAWRQFQGKDSLVANTVRSFAQTTDGSLWAATDRGVSRFDGRTWAAEALPEQLGVPNESGSLKASPSGQLWINRHVLDWNRRGWTKAPRPAPDAEFWTECHQFRGDPPRTVITTGMDRVSQPGNISILWSGAVAWREPSEGRLQYSFRLDDQPWSVYTSDHGHAFFTLESGPHHFEVRARDQDFNVDPTPAALDFVVLPPPWRQNWFISLMILFTGLIVTQSFRVIRERGRLRETNRVLAAEIDARHRAAEEIRQLNASLEQRVQDRTAQLEVANKELEAFSYSVSHDLRAPLRSINGFSRILLADSRDKLDPAALDNVLTIRAASQRMGQLIDDMLMLARVTRTELKRSVVDLSALAAAVAAEERAEHPAQTVTFEVEPGLVASADQNLIRAVLQNLLANAWKFTSKQPAARIAFGRAATNSGPAFFVRDDGPGFDPEFGHKLFKAFQRLHTVEEFPGTGVGLATVQRIIHRHGGRVWAESTPGHGATFYFTLPT